MPRPFRAARVAAFKQASDFARQCGIPAFETHCGFIPENPNDPLYREVVDAVREVAGHCRKNGQTFLYHAGQETPVTLLRTIQDVGLDNQGVGLDTANLIIGGKGHPVDALEVYGKHLKAVNAKDGLWPTDPKQFGLETPLGDGRLVVAEEGRDMRHILKCESNFCPKKRPPSAKPKGSQLPKPIPQKRTRKSMSTWRAKTG